MVVEQKDLLILRSLCERCDTHAFRLKKACTHIASLLPLQGKDIPDLSDENLGFMEMLISRFSKLQDTLGAKLFPLLLQHMQQEEEDLSFLDALHRMEKLNLLPSTKWWLDLRALRNRLVHDYPDDPKFLADNINQASQSSIELLEYWKSLRQDVEKIRKQWKQELGISNDSRKNSA